MSDISDTQNKENKMAEQSRNKNRIKNKRKKKIKVSFRKFPEGGLKHNFKNLEWAIMVLSWTSLWCPLNPALNVNKPMFSVPPCIQKISFILCFLLICRNLFRSKNHRGSFSNPNSSRSSSVTSGTDSGIENNSLDGDINRLGKSLLWAISTFICLNVCCLVSYDMYIHV